MLTTEQKNEVIAIVDRVWGSVPYVSTSPRIFGTPFDGRTVSGPAPLTFAEAQRLDDLTPESNANTSLDRAMKALGISAADPLRNTLGAAWRSHWTNWRAQQ